MVRVLIALATSVLVTGAAWADPARDALACAGFWQANYDYEVELFPDEAQPTWAEMARASEAAATRLGASNVQATVRATAEDMLPQLMDFVFHSEGRPWFRRMSRLCGAVLDREPELAPYR